MEKKKNIWVKFSLKVPWNHNTPTAVTSQRTTTPQEPQHCTDNNGESDQPQGRSMKSFEAAVCERMNEQKKEKDRKI